MDPPPLGALRQLRRLHLSGVCASSRTRWGCNLSLGGWLVLDAGQLLQLTGLEHLQLDAGCTVDQPGAACLAQLTRLTQLRVYSLRVAGASQALLQLPALQELGCAYVASQGWERVQQALLPQLTRLRVGQLYCECPRSEILESADELFGPLGEAVEGEEEEDKEEDGGRRAGMYDCLGGLLPLPKLQQLEVALPDAHGGVLVELIGTQQSLRVLALVQPARGRGVP
jgi:hypothetical protein